MIRRVVVTRRAERHIESAKAWWLENRDKAPEALAEDIDHALLLIFERPYIGTRIRKTRRRDLRRYLMRRTSHFLFYAITGDTLYIVALRHSSRRPPAL